MKIFPICAVFEKLFFSIMRGGSRENRVKDPDPRFFFCSRTEDFGPDPGIAVRIRGFSVCIRGFRSGFEDFVLDSRNFWPGTFEIESVI